MKHSFRFKRLMHRQRSTLSAGLLTEGEYGELLGAWLLASSTENLVEYIPCLEVDAFPKDHGVIGASYYEEWKSRTIAG